MPPRIVKISGVDLNDQLDNGDWPDVIAEAVEAAIASMQGAPGGSNETVQIEIANDFEPEEDEDEEEQE